jgi:FMN hydrolase / 5-amino-6-(5-phospho-D-ribitylamino)uracil phosphatase
MLDLNIVSAVSLDLDDTLWPILPTIRSAEKQLNAWLAAHSPMTAALFSTPQALSEIRDRVAATRPEIKHDLSAMRRESIRLAMYRAGEDPLQAEAAFEVFFAARNRVTLYPEATAAMDRLASKFPLVALSNGNADLVLAGVAHWFKAGVSAKTVGKGKPHVEAFDAAAAALNVPKHSVVHVGDDVSMDVFGALNAGMQAVWINREPDLESEATVPLVTRVRNLTELCEVLGA